MGSLASKSITEVKNEVKTSSLDSYPSAIEKHVNFLLQSNSPTNELKPPVENAISTEATTIESIIHSGINLILPSPQEIIPFEKEEAHQELVKELDGLLEQEKLCVSQGLYSFNPTPHKTFNVLSFDGGGIRAVGHGLIINRLLKECPWLLDKVDLFCGTSAGSQVALLLALGYSPNFVAQLGIWTGKAIFVDSRQGLSFERPNYTATYLKYLLDRITKLKGVTYIKDLKTKLAIPSYRIGNNQHPIPEPMLYHNCFQCPEIEEEIATALLKSSAAPTYFCSVGACVDGGLFANNPLSSVLPIVLGVNGLNLDKSNVRVLSIGTILEEPKPMVANEADWGLIQWLPKLVGVYSSASQQQAIIGSKMMLGDNLYRISPYSQQSIPLSDYSDVPQISQICDTFDLNGTVEWLKNHWNS